MGKIPDSWLYQLMQPLQIPRMGFAQTHQISCQDFTRTANLAAHTCFCVTKDTSQDMDGPSGLVRFAFDCPGLDCLGVAWCGWSWGGVAWLVSVSKHPKPKPIIDANHNQCGSIQASSSPLQPTPANLSQAHPIHEEPRHEKPRKAHSTLSQHRKHCNAMQGKPAHDTTIHVKPSHAGLRHAFLCRCM